MRILDKNWILETPFDYELKRYKLLGAIQKLNAIIKGGNLYEALSEVEYQLEDLYKMKNRKIEIDDRVRVLKGINIDTMSLEYEYPDQDPGIDHIYKLVDLAIDEFESMYRLIRAKWRGYSSKLNITEIPHNMPTKTQGMVFLIDSKKEIKTFSYKNPSGLFEDWKDLKLNKVDIKIEGIQEMVKYIEATIEVKNENRFWRCDHRLDLDLENALLPILQHTLYHKIFNI